MAVARFRDSVGWQKAMALIAEVLCGNEQLSERRDVWTDESTSQGVCFSRKQYCRGPGTIDNGRIHTVSGNGKRFDAGGADTARSGEDVEVRKKHRVGQCRCVSNGSCAYLECGDCDKQGEDSGEGREEGVVSKG
jgi:hypothetical protein